jgi:hypothetical protein
MKNSPILFVVVFVLSFGCDPRNLGPVGEVFGDELYWKLNAYAVNGANVPVEQAGNFSFLSFTSGNKDVAGHDLETFNFFDSNLNPTASRDLKTVSVESNKQRTIGTYIKKTESGFRFLKATVYYVKKTGVVNRLEISNLMDNKYELKNDTVRYTYFQVAKF